MMGGGLRELFGSRLLGIRGYVLFSLLFLFLSLSLFRFGYLFEFWGSVCLFVFVSGQKYGEERYCFAFWLEGRKKDMTF